MGGRVPRRVRTVRRADEHGGCIGLQRASRPATSCVELGDVERNMNISVFQKLCDKCLFTREMVMIRE